MPRRAACPGVSGSVPVCSMPRRFDVFRHAGRCAPHGLFDGLRPLFLSPFAIPALVCCLRRQLRPGVSQAGISPQRDAALCCRRMRAAVSIFPDCSPIFRQRRAFSEREQPLADNFSYLCNVPMMRFRREAGPGASLSEEPSSCTRLRLRIGGAVCAGCGTAEDGVNRRRGTMA